MKRYSGEAVVVAIALLVWVPRLSGPIDLRWDGGVYYLLSTSLAGVAEGYDVVVGSRFSRHSVLLNYPF